MGSKRPDQSRKDQLSTDRKTRTDDQHIHAEDKQAIKTERGKLALPKNEENAALSALKESRVPKGSDGK